MSQKIKARLKMRLKGGQASAAPPIGSTLGQHQVNMMDFINPFNEATKDHFEELRLEVTRLLRKLVRDLPDPDLENQTSE